MTRLEFMKQLESLVSAIPVEEREEALQYYNDYFQDAGEDHEEEIMKELGSPERISSIIKAELNSNTTDSENRGYFTEKGYHDTIYKDEKFEIIDKIPNQKQEQDNNFSNAGEKDEYQKQRKKNTNIGLIILCIFAIPIVVPLIVSVFGVLVGAIAAVLGILFGLGIAGLTMMGVGIALFIAGMIKIGIPFIGLLMCGSGLVVLGIGMLFVLVCGFLSKTVLPALVRGIVYVCRLPFRNRSVTA